MNGMPISSRVRFASLVCVLLLGLAVSASAEQIALIDIWKPAVVPAFHADLTVQPNADLLVEERFRINFAEKRTHIYRSIPIRLTDPRGFGYSVGFTFLGAEDQRGAPPSERKDSH